ncbi:hypothetical protein [Nocardia sp. NPDC052566]|uniref:hypothetical protein n=1 Tax=Nocardia sp. NPDC052566 TaxID=3364330 RepID=UPI0037CA8129
MSIRDLLYTDFDGTAVDDPDDVILDALDDPRYRQRIAPLTAILQDASNTPYDRFLACCALTSWAEPAGYRAVAEATKAGDKTVWYRELIDRRFSVDETFSQLAGAVRISGDFATDNSTEQERATALVALIGVADQFYFDWQLAAAIDNSTAGSARDEIAATVRRGIAALTQGKPPAFDLGAQLAELARSMTTVDEQLAVQLGYELARVDSSPSTLIRLTPIASQGMSPESRSFGTYLATIGDEQVQAAISQLREDRIE